MTAEVYKGRHMAVTKLTLKVRVDILTNLVYHTGSKTREHCGMFIYAPAVVCGLWMPTSASKPLRTIAGFIPPADSVQSPRVQGT